MTLHYDKIYKWKNLCSHTSEIKALPLLPTKLKTFCLDQRNVSWYWCVSMSVHACYRIMSNLICAYKLVKRWAEVACHTFLYKVVTHIYLYVYIWMKESISIGVFLPPWEVLSLLSFCPPFCFGYKFKLLSRNSADSAICVRKGMEVAPIHLRRDMYAFKNIHHISLCMLASATVSHVNADSCFY